MAQEEKISDVSPFKFAAIIVASALIVGLITIGVRKAWPNLGA